ncbi:DMT family transporter [Sulfitobacter aestuarii]|uniref:DMT family transporter n=1 Tax=Sulfitobacter aestuarii TaxID=2161676 RepID=A0ABW5U3F2_9RHOB
MIAAMLMLPLGDALSKLLTGVLSPSHVVMWRLLAQAAFMAPIAFVLRNRLRGAMFSPIIALSGALVIVTLSSLVVAFASMPVATVIAIFFVEPLLLTVLAGPLLGEKAGPRRLIAVGVGLIGALVVIRPGGSDFGWMTVLPALAALSYALNMIVLKRATATRSGLTVQCGATLYAAAGMVLFVALTGLEAPASILPDAGWAWGALIAIGALTGASHLLIAEAFRHAEASSLAPFQYVEILGATAAGYLLFGDFPDRFTWIGIAIILASGLYVFQREGVSDTAAPRRRRGVR